MGQGLIDVARAKFTEIKKVFVQMAQMALRGLQTGFSSNLSKISSSMNQIINTMNQMGNSLYNAGRNAAQSFANGFQSIHIPTPHMCISSWTRNNLGDGSIISTPHFRVNWYATGGLFRKAAIAGIGESGAEAVLLLEKRRTMNMIANSILDNASPGTGLSRDEMRQAVVEDVAMAMMNNQGNQKIPEYIMNNITLDGETIDRAVTKGQQSLDHRMNPTSKI